MALEWCQVVLQGISLKITRSVVAIEGGEVAHLKFMDRKWR